MLRPKNGRAHRSLRPSHALRRPRTQPTAARRALIEDVEQRERRSWIRHGIAGVAIAALGLGVAGSVALTGSATGRNSTSTAADVTAGSSTGSSSAVNHRALGISRGTTGQPLDGDNIDPQAAAAAQAAAAKAQKQTGVTSTSKKAESNSAAGKRSSELKSEQTKTEKLAAKLAAGANSAPVSTDKAAAPTIGQSGQTATGRQSGATKATATGAGAGHASLPITTGYSVAARFGQVGAWARYHTGFDFAAPLGTPIHAAADGVVTNAGPNARAGWAGNYVTIKHSDGTQTLYAHMASTSVSVGQSVAGGQVIGHIGMTGRSFGPHVHFEVYPAGIQPGDVYHAVNPAPWLEARGLHP